MKKMVMKKMVKMMMKMVKMMKMAGMVMVKIMGISLLILQMPISLAFLQKSIFFLHGTELGVKRTQSIKNILETFVNIQRVPGIMHA